MNSSGWKRAVPEPPPATEPVSTQAWSLTQFPKLFQQPIGPSEFYIFACLIKKFCAFEFATHTWFTVGTLAPRSPVGTRGDPSSSNARRHPAVLGIQILRILSITVNKFSKVFFKFNELSVIGQKTPLSFGLYTLYNPSKDRGLVGWR